MEWKDWPKWLEIIPSILIVIYAISFLGGFSMNFRLYAFSFLLFPLLGILTIILGAIRLKKNKTIALINLITGTVSIIIGIWIFSKAGPLVP